jgi:acetylornithine deacetylase
VRAFLSAHRIDCELQDTADAALSRPNAIGVVEGREPGPTVMFCGHLDTVGVAGMTDPFTPRLEPARDARGPRLYGRGAQDMKGGVAAMLWAAAALAPSWRKGRLVIAGVADEEFESAGADALVTAFQADAAIVTEPTDLRLAIAHKGFAWLEVTARGRAAHGSRPREGRDAIVRMGRVLGRLEALDQTLQARPPAGLQGVASLHASIIEGGRELSVYPDRCVLQYERRTVAGEDGDAPLAEAEQFLSGLRREDAEFDASVRLVTTRPPYAIDPAHPLPSALAGILDARGLDATPTGMTFWTDAAVLAAAGIPSVIFGPGGAGLHSIEEFVYLDEVDTCASVLAMLARDITR